MSVLTPLGILILSMLIMGLLYLTPGIFALFCHYSFGKFSKKHASSLAFFFILGVETGASCFFFCIYLLVSLVVADLSNLGANIFTWTLVGFLFALAVVSLFFYFRHSDGTQLFISRRIAENLDSHAKNAKTLSDAFVLGALSSTPELFFTIPLYIITSVEILKMSVTLPLSSLLTIVYILTPTVSLFITKWQFSHHRNLADIQRSRVHNKNFTRIIISLSYILIATIIICFRIN